MTSSPPSEDLERTPALTRPPRRLIVVDDHRVFAEALVLALTAEPGVDVVGMAHSVTTGLVLAQDLVPDVVVMDVRFADGDGVAATSELTRAYPGMCVIVLTGFLDIGLLQRVADAGASAFLPKDGELSDILHALRAARRGRFLVHPTLLKLLGATAGPSTQDVPELVGQESAVLQLLAGGFDTTSIARELDLMPGLAQGLVQSLLTKLGATSHLDVAVIAVRHGLLHDSSFD